MHPALCRYSSRKHTCTAATQTGPAVNQTGPATTQTDTAQVRAALRLHRTQSAAMPETRAQCLPPTSCQSPPTSCLRCQSPPVAANRCQSPPAVAASRRQSPPAAASRRQLHTPLPVASRRQPPAVSRQRRKRCRPCPLLARAQLPCWHRDTGLDSAAEGPHTHPPTRSRHQIRKLAPLRRPTLHRRSANPLPKAASPLRHSAAWGSGGGGLRSGPG